MGSFRHIIVKTLHKGDITRLIIIIIIIIIIILSSREGKQSGKPEEIVRPEQALTITV
jgi:hypothetical protein